VSDFTPDRCRVVEVQAEYHRVRFAVTGRHAEGGEDFVVIATVDGNDEPAYLAIGLRDAARLAAMLILQVNGPSTRAP
jgi:hypothetical protein